jgi:hypothetical protein
MPADFQLLKNKQKISFNVKPGYSVFVSESPQLGFQTSLEKQKILFLSPDILNSWNQKPVIELLSEHCSDDDKLKQHLKASALVPVLKKNFGQLGPMTKVQTILSLIQNSHISLCHFRQLSKTLKEHTIHLLFQRLKSMPVTVIDCDLQPPQGVPFDHYITESFLSHTGIETYDEFIQSFPSPFLSFPVKLAESDEGMAFQIKGEPYVLNEEETVNLLGFMNHELITCIPYSAIQIETKEKKFFKKTELIFQKPETGQHRIAFNFHGSPASLLQPKRLRTPFFFYRIHWMNCFLFHATKRILVFPQLASDTGLLTS